MKGWHQLDKAQYQSSSYIGRAYTNKTFPNKEKLFSQLGLGSFVASFFRLRQSSSTPKPLPQQDSHTWDKGFLLPSLSHLGLGSSASNLSYLGLGSFEASLSRLGLGSFAAKPLPLRTRLFRNKAFPLGTKALLLPSLSYLGLGSSAASLSHLG
ncbi:hypothetical protein Adt_18565 [Abeliophyllum distichum]|uniref:Uncharacterized protein n=1 Tax=Abeliophyllum distichum TaxID=126358 RepID=A0ABD1TJQ9_9LAMI